MSDDKNIFYVSPEGNDAWSGRAPVPGGNNGPFATICAARNTIRALKKAGKTGKQKTQVFLRGGTYHLERTFRLAPEDSGSIAGPVIYAAYPGEVPVISGGRRITGWTATTLKGMPCWTADLPEVKSGKWYFTQLFVNGRRMPRPRLPKKGYYEFTGLAGAGKVAPDWTMHGPRKASFAPGHIRNWKNLTDVEIVSLMRWFDSHNYIARVEAKRHTVHFKKDSLGSLLDSATDTKFARYYVENVFETLDTPGEWHLDRHAGRLFYLPLATQKLAAAEIIAPYLSEIVRFQGSKNGEPVEHVHFENIAFQHAEWVLPGDDPGSTQAAFKVPGAVVFDGAENCVLFGCAISKISQYGVEFLAGCSRNRVAGCSFFDMGAGGIKIGHEELLREDDDNPVKVAPGARRLKYMCIIVSDCTIHGGGLIYPGTVGIWIGNSGRNNICHNHVFNMPYTGISCGWAWDEHLAEPTRSVCNRIENNHVHHVGDLLYDNGGIYVLGRQPGTVVRGNLIHDIVNFGTSEGGHGGGHGIYLDGAWMILVENNVLYKNKGSVLFCHNRNNVVRNNIFSPVAGNCLLTPCSLRRSPAALLKNNIVYQMGGPARIYPWRHDDYRFENNVFWQDDNRPDAALKRILNSEMAKGQHENSIVADPLFVDPPGGDFSLRKDSPALKIGFKPVDMSKCGARFQACRPESYEKYSRRYPVDCHPSRAALQKSLLALKQWKPAEKIPREHPEWKIKRVPLVGNPGLIKKRLGDCRPLFANIFHLDCNVAEIRMAVSGKNLAIHAVIMDEQVKTATPPRNSSGLGPPWNASCLALFCSMPNSKTVTRLNFQLSQTGKSALATICDRHACVPAAGIKAEYALRPDGYELCALVPFASLALQDNPRTFLMEWMVVAALSAAGPYQAVSVFAQGVDGANNAEYGLITIEE